MSYYRTPEHRRLRAELIRQWKPWEQSTGPRTEAGKATSARNSRKHGNRSREEEADRIIAIGSDRMMVGVGKARHDVLKQFLKPHHFAIGSINSPMQCMMKEICAQCLQQH